jgi:hypothetical protein
MWIHRTLHDILNFCFQKLHFKNVAYSDALWNLGNRWPIIVIKDSSPPGLSNNIMFIRKWKLINLRKRKQIFFGHVGNERFFIPKRIAIFRKWNVPLLTILINNNNAIFELYSTLFREFFTMNIYLYS